MKILVAVKRVIDYNVQIRVKEDGTGIVTENVKMSTNPPDDNAIEEAVKIKESGKAKEIVAITIGEDKAQETVRKALAVGADRGIHVKADGIVEPLAVSKILQKIVEKEKPDLIFMGKQAIDDDCNQTGQMLASLLNLPQATFASKIEVKDKSLEVTREVDEGLETIEVHNIKDADVLGNNPIYENGKVVGRATGGDFGFRLNKSIALGMIKPELATSGQKLKIDILGKMHDATILEESPYDPENKLLRA